MKQYHTIQCGEDPTCLLYKTHPHTHYRRICRYKTRAAATRTMSRNIYQPSKRGYFTITHPLRHIRHLEKELNP